MEEPKNEVVRQTVRKKVIRGVEHTFTLDNDVVGITHPYSPDTYYFNGNKQIPDVEGKFAHAIDNAEKVGLAPDMSESTAEPHVHTWNFMPANKDPNKPNLVNEQNKKIVPKPKANKLQAGFCTTPGCTSELKWVSFAAVDSWGNKQGALVQFPENKIVATQESLDPHYFLNRFKPGMK